MGFMAMAMFKTDGLRAKPAHYLRSQENPTRAPPGLRGCKKAYEDAKNRFQTTGLAICTRWINRSFQLGLRLVIDPPYWRTSLVESETTRTVRE
jgi:hypothetical protein